LTKWIYDYVDGMLEGVRHGVIGVDVVNYGSHINVRKGSGEDYFNVEIPTRNIVETRQSTLWLY